MLALDLDGLKRRAARGDAAAMTGLGRLHLAAGLPEASAAEGIALLERAAEAGSGEALSLLAVLAGLGAWRERSWTDAFALLARAAEAGWPLAQDQLLLLAADRAAAARAISDRAAPGIWKALADAIELGHWTARLVAGRVAHRPRIGELKNFLAPEICDWFIARARGRLEPARVFDAETGGSRIERERSNSAYEFEAVDSDLVLLLVRERIAAVFGVPSLALEKTNILHYTVGQEFSQHVDYFDPVKPGFAERIATSGQRIATFLVYLNEGYEGGETEFPLVQFRYKGAKGDAMLFMNVDQATATPDPYSRHAGLPPTRGEKWILSQWIRGSSKPRPPGR